jgi:hypothetical protein
VCLFAGQDADVFEPQMQAAAFLKDHIYKSGMVYRHHAKPRQESTRQPKQVL